MTMKEELEFEDLEGEAIPFTQFMRPDGHQVERTIVRPAEIANQAKALVKAGVRFEAEVLRNGMVSFEAVISAGGEIIPLATAIVLNGPKVPAAVDTLIKKASERLHEITITLSVQER